MVFEKNIIKTASVLSLLASKSPYIQSTVLKDLSINYRYFAIKETEGFVVEFNKIVYVAIRNAEVFPKNFAIRDLLTLFTFGGKYFHAGFMKYFGNIKPILESLPNKRIIMTGHSLGGAVANIASHYISADCITFGAPRFSHIKITNEKSLNIVFDGDYVSEFPFFFMKDKPNKAYIDSNGGLSSKRTRVYFSNPITNHSMKNYLDIVDKM